MSTTYNGIFVANQDGSGEMYGASAIPQEPEPEPQFEHSYGYGLKVKKLARTFTGQSPAPLSVNKGDYIFQQYSSFTVDTESAYLRFSENYNLRLPRIGKGTDTISADGVCIEDCMITGQGEGSSRVGNIAALNLVAPWEVDVLDPPTTISIGEYTCPSDKIAILVYESSLGAAATRINQTYTCPNTTNIVNWFGGLYLAYTNFTNCSYYIVYPNETFSYTDTALEFKLFLLNASDYS